MDKELDCNLTCIFIDPTLSYLSVMSFCFFNFLIGNGLINTIGEIFHFKSMLFSIKELSHALIAYYIFLTLIDYINLVLKEST